MEHGRGADEGDESPSDTSARRGDAATIDALRAAIAAVPPGGSASTAGIPGRRTGTTHGRTAHARTVRDVADETSVVGRPGARPPRGGRQSPQTDLSTEDAAREYLLRSLTASARSRHQLASGLAKRDVPDDVAERLLDRFEEVGLVDDEALAHAIVRSRSQETGAARRRIATELRRKGIPDEIVQDALAQVDDEDERRAAYDLARSRARRLASLERDVALRRLVGFLGRKGYPPSLCLDAARAGLDRLTDAASPDDAL